MKKLSLYLLLLTAALSAWGGTVYLPLVVDGIIAGNFVCTEILITNNDPVEFRSYTFLYIPTGTDGSDREGDPEPPSVLVAPLNTIVLENRWRPATGGWWRSPPIPRSRSPAGWW